MLEDRSKWMTEKLIQKNYDDVDIVALREVFECAGRGHMVRECPTQVWREEGSSGGGSDKGKGKGRKGHLGKGKASGSMSKGRVKGEDEGKGKRQRRR